MAHTPGCYRLPCGVDGTRNGTAKPVVVAPGTRTPPVPLAGPVAPSRPPHGMRRKTPDRPPPRKTTIDTTKEQGLTTKTKQELEAEAKAAEAAKGEGGSPAQEESTAGTEEEAAVVGGLWVANEEGDSWWAMGQQERTPENIVAIAKQYAEEYDVDLAEALDAVLSWQWKTDDVIEDPDDDDRIIMRDGNGNFIRPKTGASYVPDEDKVMLMTWVYDPSAYPDDLPTSAAVNENHGGDD